MADAYSYAFDETTTVHGSRMMNDHLKVKIHRIIEKYGHLPLPVPVPAYDIDTTATALGTWVQWPKDLAQMLSDEVVVHICLHFCKNNKYANMRK